MNLWFKRIYFVIFQLILFLQLSGISYGFFKIDIILNCEPKGSYYPDTYKKIRYFKFNEEELELDWSVVDKKFLNKPLSNIQYREAFYEIILFNGFNGSQVFNINRISGMMTVDWYATQIYSSNNKKKLRDTTYYDCKKITKSKLPKVNIKQKF